MDSIEPQRCCYDQVIVTEKDLLHRPAEMLLFDMADSGFIGLDEGDIFALQKTVPQMLYFQNSCKDSYELSNVLKSMAEKIHALAGCKNMMCLVQCNAADMCIELLEDIEEALSSHTDVALWQMKEYKDTSNNQITISLLVGERVPNDTPLA